MARIPYAFIYRKLSIPIFIALVFLFSDPVSAFKILEPSESTPLKPGQMVTVRLDLGEMSNIIQSKFYWYGEQEDMLKEFVDERLALVSTNTNTPPFGGTLRVPRTAVGNYRLLAVAEGEEKLRNQALWAIFDEVMLRVEPDADLEHIDFETDKPLRLGRAGSVNVYGQVDFLGKVVELPVVGTFSDGVTRPMRLHSTGMSYHSSNEKVVTINSDGLMRVIGNGTAMVTAQSRGKESTLEVVVEVNDEPNEAPVPDAGPSQTIKAGTRVQLERLEKL